MKDEFLSEEDLDLKNLSDAELEAYWDLWLRQAQSTNQLDAHLYSHGVFVEEPRVEPFPLRPEEREVLDFMLAGEGEVLAALRRQTANILVRRKSLTTAGFYLDFAITPGSRELPGKPSFQIDDVQAEVRKVSHGMGLILWVKGGFAHCLEGYVCEDELPRVWQLEGLVYVDAFRSVDPPIERPAARAAVPGQGLHEHCRTRRETSAAREQPPPYPRP